MYYLEDFSLEKKTVSGFNGIAMDKKKLKELTLEEKRMETGHFGTKMGP